MPTPTLSALPYDILRIITSYLPTASSLTSFSTTCKSLHSFITTEGWRVFLQTRFPSFHAEVIRELQSRHLTVQPADWLTWVQEQTLVRRNWERRGFIARVLEPEVGIYVPTGPRAGMWGRKVEPPKRWQWVPGGSRGRQTMKYLPVLDAYESVWGSGEEVLAIGAGPDLVLRKCKGGDEERWWGFEDRAERAGRDDVTALQLLRYGEKGGYGKGEVAVVGRANGKLEMVGLRTDGDAARIGKSDVLERYETGGLTVKSASLLHREGNGMMSAVLSNSNIALYPISTPESSTPQIPTVNPISELILTEGEIPWKTTFLSPSLLALGTTSPDPLAIFTISPDDGIRKTPLRTFSATECTGTKTMGVYATASLPTSAGTPENAGETFLGGWYDGVSRLHDLRSPAQFVATYTDPIDAQTPIYSIAPLGRQRFIVGGGRHCILKIFDLRMSGVYDYAHPSSPGWATYLSPPARYRPHSSSADWESPIYSLVVGASGKTVYAGAQGRVWGMDFVGTERRMVRPLSPLPLVQPSVSVRKAAVSAAKDVGTRLTMYEFGWTGTMYRQGPESEMGSAGLYDGRIDGRWRATLSCEE